MGGNQNISILMLFECVRVNTGLGFHWICNREKKRGGYMWIDDDINLEPFFSITHVGHFWLVKTYQYGCYPSVLSHHALGTAEYDESYCIEGVIFGCSFVGVRGFCFYHESYCDESVIMTIYGFLNIQIFCDVSFGMELCSYMGNGCVYGVIWFPPSLLEFLGCMKNHTPYYSRVMMRSSSQSGWSLRNIHISNDYGSFYVDVFFPPSVPRFYRKWLYISNTVELLIHREHLRTRSVLWWDSCCSSSFFVCCPFKFIYVLSSVLWYPLRFSHTNDGRFVFTSTCL